MLGFRFIGSVKKKNPVFCGGQTPTSHARRPHSPMNIRSSLRLQIAKASAHPKGWALALVVAGEGFEPTTSGL